MKNNEASVKFKRKLIKGSGVCNTVIDENNSTSKPVSPNIVFPPTPGLCKSEMRSSTGGDEKCLLMGGSFQQQSSSSLMKNRSSSYVDK